MFEPEKEKDNIEEGLNTPTEEEVKDETVEEKVEEPEAEEAQEEATPLEVTVDIPPVEEKPDKAAAKEEKANKKALEKANKKEAAEREKAEQQAIKDAAKAAEKAAKQRVREEKAILASKGATARKTLNSLSVLLAAVAVICMLMNLVTVALTIDGEEIVKDAVDSAVGEEVKEVVEVIEEEASIDIDEAVEEDADVGGVFSDMAGTIEVDLSVLSISENLDAVKDFRGLEEVEKVADVVQTVIFIVLMVAVFFFLIALILTSCQSGKTYIFTLITSLVTMLIGAALVLVTTLFGDVSDMVAIKGTVYLWILVGTSIVNIIYIAFANKWMK